MALIFIPRCARHRCNLVCGVIAEVASFTLLKFTLEPRATLVQLYRLRYNYIVTLD
jgi:hypothetical protein